jgi:hypothetical protein
MSHRLPACVGPPGVVYVHIYAKSGGLFSVAATQAGSLCYIDPPECRAMFHNTCREIREPTATTSEHLNSYFSELA